MNSKRLIPIVLSLAMLGGAAQSADATVAWVTSTRSQALMVADDSGANVRATAVKGQFGPRVSPDGNRVAIQHQSGSGRNGISLLNLLTGAVVNGPAGGNNFVYYDWLPDSATLLVGNSTGKVVPVNADTGQAGAPVFSGKAILGLSVAPDGSQMAVVTARTSNPDQESLTDLSIVDLTTGAVRQITSDRRFEKVKWTSAGLYWSSSVVGRKITRTSIWTLGASGQATQLLAAKYPVPMCCFDIKGATPDGSNVVVALTGDDYCDAFRLNTATKALTRMLPRRTKTLACPYGVTADASKILAVNVTGEFSGPLSFYPLAGGSPQRIASKAFDADING